MKRTRNLLFVAGGLVAVVIFALVASRRGGPAALPVTIQKVAYAPFSVKLPENGTVMRPLTVTIPTLIGGNIDKIYVKAGDSVGAGQLLATIDNPTVEFDAAGSSADYSNSVANVSSARINEENSKVQYVAAVATQKSAYDEARRVYEADVALYDQRAIPRSQVDADKAKLDQAKVAYDQAVEQLRLGALSGYGQTTVKAAQAAAEKARIIDEQNQQQVAFTRITAPGSGVIQTVAANPNDPLRPVQQGDAVTAGQALFTLAQSAGYIVRAQVDEQDIYSVRVGQQASVSSEDFQGKTIPGHVVEVAPVAIKSNDPSSTAKQVLVTVALDQSPAYLKDGLTVDVDIYTTQIRSAIAVASDAVRKDGKKSYVFLDRNGKAEKRYVTTGLSNDTQTLVTQGLSAGDLVISDKNAVLTAGTAVTPKPSPSGSPSAGGASITIGG